MFLKPLKYFCILTISSTILFANDTEIANIKSETKMAEIIKSGTHKQQLFLALNPNISDNIIEELLKINDSVISSTVKDNLKFSEYMERKAYLENLKQQEIINKRRTINFYIQDLNKIQKVIKKMNNENDEELKEFYMGELLSLIEQYKNVFYKLDDLEINRALASLNISKETIKYLLTISKHKDDFIIRKNILKNRFIKTSEFSDFFKNEQNHFLLFYLTERNNKNNNNPNYDNRGDINKIIIQNESNTNTNVNLAL